MPITNYSVKDIVGQMDSEMMQRWSEHCGFVYGKLDARNMEMSHDPSVSIIADRCADAWGDVLRAWDLDGRRPSDPITFARYVELHTRFCLHFMRAYDRSHADELAKIDASQPA